MFEPPAVERFWAKVTKTDGCWLWTGAITKGTGYGRQKVNKKGIDSHRLSWMIHFGEIPAGMLVCHTCDVRACVNPGHLFLGTFKDNYEDCLHKGRLNRGFAYGELSGSVKLTEAQVREIRSRFKPGDKGYRGLAKTYGVHPDTIRRVIFGIKWKHVA